MLRRGSQNSSGACCLLKILGRGSLKRDLTPRPSSNWKKKAGDPSSLCCPLQAGGTST